jgi:hypothetical protein
LEKQQNKLKMNADVSDGIRIQLCSDFTAVNNKAGS